MVCSFFFFSLPLFFTFGRAECCPTLPPKGYRGTSRQSQLGLPQLHFCLSQRLGTSPQCCDDGNPADHSATKVLSSPHASVMKSAKSQTGHARATVLYCLVTGERGNVQQRRRPAVTNPVTFAAGSSLRRSRCICHGA